MKFKMKLNHVFKVLWEKVSGTAGLSLLPRAYITRTFDRMCQHQPRALSARPCCRARCQITAVSEGEQ